MMTDQEMQASIGEKVRHVLDALAQECHNDAQVAIVLGALVGVVNGAMGDEMRELLHTMVTRGLVAGKEAADLRAATVARA